MNVCLVLSEQAAPITGFCFAFQQFSNTGLCTFPSGMPSSYSVLFCDCENFAEDKPFRRWCSSTMAESYPECKVLFLRLHELQQPTRHIKSVTDVCVEHRPHFLMNNKSINQTCWKMIWTEWKGISPSTRHQLQGNVTFRSREQCAFTEQTLQMVSGILRLACSDFVYCIIS